MKHLLALALLMTISLPGAYGGPGRGSEVGNGRMQRSVEAAPKQADPLPGDAAPRPDAPVSSVLSLSYSGLSLRAGEKFEARILIRVPSPERVVGCESTLASNMGSPMAFGVDTCRVRKLDELTYDVRIKHQFPKKWASRSYWIQDVTLLGEDGANDRIETPVLLIQVTNPNYSELKLLGAESSASVVKVGESFELVVKVRSDKKLSSAIDSIIDHFAGDADSAFPESVYLWPIQDSVDQSLDKADGVVTLRIPLFVSESNAELTRLEILGITVRNAVLQEAFLPFEKPLIVQMAK